MCNSAVGAATMKVTDTVTGSIKRAVSSPKKAVETAAIAATAPISGSFLVAKNAISKANDKKREKLAGAQAAAQTERDDLGAPGAQDVAAEFDPLKPVESIQGRTSTLLTGPLGLQSKAKVRRKTLLGG